MKWENMKQTQRYIIFCEKQLSSFFAHLPSDFAAPKKGKYFLQYNTSYNRSRKIASKLKQEKERKWISWLLPSILHSYWCYSAMQSLPSYSIHIQSQKPEILWWNDLPISSYPQKYHKSPKNAKNEIQKNQLKLR